MPTTPRRNYASDPHTPYLVSVMVTRAELDTLSDAVADWEDGARDDGDASLVAGADRVAGLLSRIERSWLAERDQHTLARVAAESHAETLDRATLTDAELGV